MNDTDRAKLDDSLASDADWEEYRRLHIDHHSTCDARTGRGGGCTCPADFKGVAMVTAAEFMARAPAPVNANTPWGSRYAAELRRVVVEHARHAPRSLQVHLGPSELGHVCDRQVVGKMAGVPATNHITDPWPSIVGTAVHAWLADAFTAANTRHGIRFVAEHRVTPHPDHPGTADLYDAAEQAVVDHKVLSESSMAKVRKQPPQHYVVQLLLYGRGYRLLGLPVRRVVLAAWPRTGSTVDGLYVWDHPITPDDDALVEAVFARTSVRAQVAAEVRAGRLPLHLVPATPDVDVCYFCALYRPQASRDGGPGCPGTATSPSHSSTVHNRESNSRSRSTTRSSGGA